MYGSYNKSTNQKAEKNTILARALKCVCIITAMYCVTKNIFYASKKDPLAWYTTRASCLQCDTVYRDFTRRKDSKIKKKTMGRIYTRIESVILKKQPS